MTGRDEHGRVKAITVINEIRPFREPINRVLFAFARLKPSRTGLHKVQLLHFVRFCLLRSFPYNGPPQEPERPAHPLLILEDHYNGMTDPYIEVFIRALSEEIDLTWRTTYGYPGVRSVTRTTRLLKQLVYSGAYYYSAYPDATVTTIRSALEVARDSRFVEPYARRLDAAEFAAAYREFLVRRQEDL